MALQSLSDEALESFRTQDTPTEATLAVTQAVITAAGEQVRHTHAHTHTHTHTQVRAHTQAVLTRKTDVLIQCRRRVCVCVCVCVCVQVAPHDWHKIRGALSRDLLNKLCDLNPMVRVCVYLYTYLYINLAYRAYTGGTSGP